ncbi:hypothetical protein, partial [Thermus scotoductus]|uniref:hypothetical protein n=1 Tax=Thermus scotoductus TaxID=37636 RepID=UPI001001FAE5
MEVQILAEAQVLHPPRWALVDYGPLPNGGSLLAVWRYDREGRPVSLHAPNRAWVERVLRELLPGERGVEWTHPRLLPGGVPARPAPPRPGWGRGVSLINISEPTRPLYNSNDAVCLKKK